MGNFWEWIDKSVFSMAFLRLLSGTLEISAAILMLRINDVGKALMVNSSLALVGPFILLTTTTIGLIGVANRISLDKILLVFMGILLIFIGVRK